LLWKRWYSRYWHVILIEKYTSWWKDECQVHFVRRSHLDGDGCLQVVVDLFPLRTVSNERFLFAAAKLIENISLSFFCAVCLRKKRNQSFPDSFMNNFFRRSIVSGMLFPTCFFATMLCNVFVLHEKREKRQKKK
jgi:hypothetical protein